MRTFRFTSSFLVRLPLRFLLTGGNVSSYVTVTYAPRLRHIFGYSKLALFLRKNKAAEAQVSLLQA